MSFEKRTSDVDVHTEVLDDNRPEAEAMAAAANAEGDEICSLAQDGQLAVQVCCANRLLWYGTNVFSKDAKPSCKLIRDGSAPYITRVDKGAGGDTMDMDRSVSAVGSVILVSNS